MSRAYFLKHFANGEGQWVYKQIDRDKVRTKELQAKENSLYSYAKP